MKKTLKNATRAKSVCVQFIYTGCPEKSTTLNLYDLTKNSI